MQTPAAHLTAAHAHHASADEAWEQHPMVSAHALHRGASVSELKLSSLEPHELAALLESARAWTAGRH